MSGCIVGWAHSKFGKHEGRDIESLIVEVTQAALADAGVAAADIDTVYLGTMNGGFVRQEFPASLVFQADPGFRFKPATRVEDACATGSAAIHQGLNAIAAGRARLALVVGVEKMTEVSGAQVGDILLGASYRKEEDAIEGGFAGIFGKIAQSYFQRYGDQSDALARIAAKNHKNGVANPLAQMQKDLGYEFCRTVSDKNPIVAGPLEAHRLLAGVGRRRGGGARRHRDRAEPEEGGHLPRRRAGQRLSADEPARRRRLRRAGTGLAAGARRRAARSRRPRPGRDP